jgi:hypothetical protein
MSDAKITNEQFRDVAPTRLSFLEDKGFQRMMGIEETTPTGSSLVYIGKNVGFVFSLDVRDQCVDAQVVRVRNGKIARNSDGGYSSDLFTHLVNNAGYRGKSAVSRDMSEGGQLDRMIAAWVELIQDAGQSLLSDRSDALPT